MKDRDHFEEALRQLERAQPGPERARLRALEAVRAGLQLELHDHARARVARKRPNAEQLAQLEQNVLDAWAAYDAVSAGGLETALRALQGIREAIGALRAATAKDPGRAVPVMFAAHEGDPIGTIELPVEGFYDFYKVPQRYRSDRHKVRVQMHLSGDPEVCVYGARGKLLWRSPSKPAEGPAPHMALPNEIAPNAGNGRTHGEDGR